MRKIRDIVGGLIVLAIFNSIAKKIPVSIFDSAWTGYLGGKIAGALGVTEAGVDRFIVEWGIPIACLIAVMAIWHFLAYRDLRLKFSQANASVKAPREFLGKESLVERVGKLERARRRLDDDGAIVTENIRLLCAIANSSERGRGHAVQRTGAYEAILGPANRIAIDCKTYLHRDADISRPPEVFNQIAPIGDEVNDIADLYQYRQMVAWLRKADAVLHDLKRGYDEEIVRADLPLTCER